MTPQTPPTDRPLTADEPLWMVHVLGPDEIYPAPDHATAVEWCAGMNGAIPGSDVLCVAVPALWTGSSKDHAAGLKDARDDFAALARPATSAASEGEGDDLDDDDASTHAASMVGLSDYLWNQALAAESVESRGILEMWREAIDALASPPVSERERELEGALRGAVEAFTKIVQADIHHEGFNIDTDTNIPEGAVSRTWVGPLGLIAKRARKAIDKALTTQPAGEGK